MNKVCEFVPDQGLVAECKEMVDAYLPEILNMIKEELVSSLHKWKEANAI